MKFKLRKIKDLKQRLSKLHYKLILVTSLIMFCSFTGMLLIASIFFSREAELRIRENNLDLILYAQQWLDAEIRNYHREGTLFFNRKSLPNQLESLLFFQKLPEILYIGLSSKKNNSHSYYNKAHIETIGLSKTEILSSLKENRTLIQEAWSEKKVIFNASINTHPLLGFSYLANNNVITLLFDPSFIQKNFQFRKYITIFIVDEKGNILIHPDSRLLASKANLIGSPVIKKVWQSSVKTGQDNYTDPNTKESFITSYIKLTEVPLAMISEIKKDIAFAPVDLIFNRNLIIMLLFTLLSIGVSYLFAKLITTPVNSLVGATKEIEEGNYNINIIPTSKDEIGWLTQSFQKMVHGLQEREKIKHTFGRFVNKKIAERALKGEINLGGEKKFVAIFFSDLRNFTKTSEKMRPEAVVSYLNAYFTEMVKCISETDGNIDKYIGDAIMAHWGALEEIDNGTKNAVKAALKMREKLKAFNKKGIYPPTRIGCGINSGEIFAGQIGSQEKLEYTIIGDAVNSASRIEGLNKTYGTDILISENSYNLVKHLFKVEKISNILLRGRSETINLYAVLGMIGDNNCPQSIEELKQDLMIS